MMDVTVSRSDLAHALKIASGILPGPKDNPQPQHWVLLRAEDTLQVIAMDWGETVFRARLNASVAEQGASLVPAQALLGIISSIRDPEIRLVFSDKDGRLRIDPGGFFIAGDSPEPIPLPTPKGPSVAVSLGELLAAMKRVVFATRKSDTNRQLTSITIRTDDLLGAAKLLNTPVITLMASDAYRLAIQAIPAQNPQGANFAVPVDKSCAKILEMLAKWIGGVKRGIETVRLTLAQSDEQGTRTRLRERFLAFQLPNADVFYATDLSEPINLPMSKYSEYLSSQGVSRAIASAQDMLSVLEPVWKSHGKRDKTLGVWVRISASRDAGGMIVSLSHSTGPVQVSGTIPAEVIGEPFQFKANCKFLVEALNQLGGKRDKKVILSFYDHHSPLGLRLEYDPSFVYLFMPGREE